MPTYFATGTKVHLCVSNLTKSTTAYPEQRKSTGATKKAEEADTLLKNGCRLKEDMVACCEDRGRLHFLGKYKDMPFFLVHAGADLFRPQSSNKDLRGNSGGLLAAPSDRDASGVSTESISTLSSLPSTPTGSEADRIENECRRSSDKRRGSVATKVKLGDASLLQSGAGGISKLNVPLSSANLQRVSAAHPVDLTPQALTVVVALTDKSFLRSFAAPPTAQDVKLDVFLNGEFVCSKYVSARYRAEKKKTDELTQQFSGIRVHRLLEHAWVILPPGQNPDGSLRGLKRTKAASVGVEERWSQIAAELRKEADEVGFDKYGCRPPVGDYLVSLSELEMPPAVAQMQKPGGLKYGVIDVVLSVGKGKKYDASSYYLTAPERLHDEDFAVSSDDAGITEQPGGRGRADAQPSATEAEHGLPTPLPSSSLNAFPELSSLNLPASQPTISAQLEPLVGTSNPFAASLIHGPPSTSQGMPSRQARRSRRNTAPVQPTSMVSNQTNSSPPLAVQSLFPPVPSLPTQDFDGIISSSSFRKKISWDRRRATFDIPRSSARSVQLLSSPEDRHHRGGQMRLSQPAANGSSQVHFRDPFSSIAPRRLSEPSSFSSSPNILRSTPAASVPLFTSKQCMSSRRLSMAPPQMPVLPITSRTTGATSSVLTITGSQITSSPSTSRYARRLSTSDSAPSPKRRRLRRDSTVTMDRRASDGQKTVEGFFGVSRRGVFTRRDSMANVSHGQGRHPATEGDVPASLASGQRITRIVLKAKDTIIRVHDLSSPFYLSTDSSIQPLDTAPIHHTIDPAFTVSDLSAPPATPVPLSSPTHAPKVTEATPAARSSPTKPRVGRLSSRRTEDASGPALTGSFMDHAFATPALSQDCVITYAQKGAWSESSSDNCGGVLRQIKSARPGEFKEDSILMGVRFLVG